MLFIEFPLPSSLCGQRITSILQLKRLRVRELKTNSCHDGQSRDGSPHVGNVLETGHTHTNVHPHFLGVRLENRLGFTKLSPKERSELGNVLVPNGPFHVFPLRAGGALSQTWGVRASIDGAVGDVFQAWLPCCSYGHSSTEKREGGVTIGLCCADEMKGTCLQGI